MKKYQMLFPLFAFFALPLLFPTAVKADAKASALWGVGVQLGYAELGANQGVSPVTLTRSLAYARDLAKESGCLASDELEKLRQEMSRTRDSRTLYQRITAYRQGLPSVIQNNCHCAGDRSNAAVALWGLGVQIGYAEIASFLSIPTATLIQSLSSARDHALLLDCLDTKRIEELITAMRRTNNSRTLYQSISSYRQQDLYIAVQRDCNCAGISCKPFEGLWQDTTNGIPLNLKRTGNRVTGSYIFRGVSGSLSGTVNNNVLEGEWSQPAYPDPKYRRGRMKFVLSADGKSWKGEWWDDNGVFVGAWNGACRNDR